MTESSKVANVHVQTATIFSDLSGGAAAPSAPLLPAAVYCMPF